MKSRILMGGLLIGSLLSFRAAAMKLVDEESETRYAWAHEEEGGSEYATMRKMPRFQAEPSLYDRTIGKVDAVLQCCYNAAVNNPVAVGYEKYKLGKKSHPYNRLDRQPAEGITNLVEFAGVVAGAALAYKYRASVLPHVTWNNAANVAGGLYLANKLAPDWLKGFAARIPVLRRLVSRERFRVKHYGSSDEISWLESGASLSPSLACAEYAAMGGIGYGLRNHISPSNVAKVALVTGVANIVMPQCVRKLALKVPVLRRLV